jgi:hypothetical protein
MRWTIRFCPTSGNATRGAPFAGSWHARCSLLATSASLVSDVLHRHFARIGAQHDLVKALRDHLA